ncbi:Fasciclin-like arabinogalactan protein 2 [Acorus gramineus]|uniref:Fasciclin-like arabinogalactan protein 2 n=1 Tax=Acorus gramineus TaxID=55184 RepID=A0AAV9AWJ9_ACOGR|nr:Fasciclin-like arabinogalactan protein 2 [Acorus gramineus]
MQAMKNHLFLAATLLLLMSAAAPLTVDAADTPGTHNITKILAQFPQFSTFNHYLTTSHLAVEINQRQTITVLAVDNAGMASLLAKKLPLYTIKNVLSLHVLVDYFGAKKLHQITDGTALVSSMFQATGAAPGTTGFVNITDLPAGHVGFGAQDSGSLDARFVKSVVEHPYKISVIQISTTLVSPEAQAPTPAPSQLNFTTLMSKQGCKKFADLILAAPEVEKTFESDIGGGLTIFCPADIDVTAFMPKFKNLTKDQQSSLLMYHGVPVYNSMSMLKTSNGIMNTLATVMTAKNREYNFTVQNDGTTVTLKTKIVTASITGTLFDEQPLAIYIINKVLEPRELFKKAEALTPAPSPAPAASAPSADASASPAAAEPDSAPDDKAADASGAVMGRRIGGGVVVGLALMLGMIM